MKTDEVLKGLEKMKQSLQQLEKEIILEQGKLEQEYKNLRELGFDSLEELEAEITRMEQELDRLTKEGQALLKEFQETYADYI